MSMKHYVNKGIKKVIRSAINLTSRTKIGEYINEQVLSDAMNRSTQIIHNGTKIQIITPNALCNWRAKTFSTKEPETLQWIDNIPENSTIWDIGANIGLYSIYAAKKRHCRVWAFEPAVFNLELLARNIFLNGLVEQVCIVPIALTKQLSESNFRLTNTNWGAALSTFGEDFGWDGSPLKSIFEYKTLGLSMIDASKHLGIPMPDYIKMDVDGIEHLILQGGADLLKHIKGILIEVNNNFHEQAEESQLALSQAGLTQVEKHHSDVIANSNLGLHNTLNQIWSRY